MKHLTLLGEHGMTGIPRTVAELGPGASLGIGLAAILSGSSRYYALDVVRRAHVEANLVILGNLVELFRERAGSTIGGWPDFSAYLNRDRFPGHILTDGVLAESLSGDRVTAIRVALQNPGKSVDGITIDYMVPWSRDSVLRCDSVDLAVSHSVLEHVTDLNATYRALNRWLKPGALMSHQIDFTSHGLSRKWNGHRACSELTWKVVVGRQPYLINRAPYSVHRSLVLQNDFELVCEMQNFRDDGISRDKLARHWLHITDDDLNCAGAFLQARKRHALHTKAPQRLPSGGRPGAVRST
jgi:hypothetical protein